MAKKPKLDDAMVRSQPVRSLSHEAEIVQSTPARIGSSTLRYEEQAFLATVEKPQSHT